MSPQRSIFLVALLCVFGADAAAVVGRPDRDEASRLARGARYPAAGRVLPDGGCTLVAPRWALTAAHVAANLRPGSKVDFDGQMAVVSRVVLHPEGESPPGRPPEVDLALLQFAEPVAGVEPIAPYRGKDELGTTLVLVGHGDFGTAGSPIHHSDGRRRAVENAVDDAGPKRLFLRFDAPPAGVADEGVGAAGDSGGPAILELEGKPYLAGVSSASMDGKPGQYGVVDVYTRVGSYLDWIDATIAGR
jgi:hypothetical protein